MKPGLGALPWLGGLLAVYLLAPLAVLIPAVRGAGGAAALPGLWRALATSIAAASCATAVIAVTGVPLADLLARGRARWLGAVGILVQLPLALPPLVGGILLLLLFGPFTPLGRLTGGALTDSFAGIVLAQTFVAAPFLVVAARAAFATIAPQLEEVAETLGHRPGAVFWRVRLPLAWPGIRAGLLLAWLRAFGEFGATVMVAYHPYSLPVYTYAQFGGTGLAATLLPVICAVVAALGILAVASVSWRRRARRRSPSLPAPTHPPALVVPADAGLRFHVSCRLAGFHLDVPYAGGARHVALLGPSGAGKSLTLRLLAGLGPRLRGELAVGTVELGALAARARGVGYVPQDYALMPHLAVGAQALFGVGADPALAAYWLERLGLRGLADRASGELSGGQRQRVALVRALARGPRLLLLDEPLAALDAPVRVEIRRELRRLQRDFGLPTVLVTHDPAEAAHLAEDVLVLDGGCVLQAGRVGDVFARPVSAEVARLCGWVNLVVGEVRDGRLWAGAFSLPAPPGAPAGPVLWSIRPEDVLLDAGGQEATIVDRMGLAGATELHLRLAGGVELIARPSGAAPAVGGRCGVRLPADGLVLWPRDAAS